MSETPNSKARSPVAPSYSLRQSFEDVRKIYNQYSHATFSLAEVASSLSASATSSTLRQKLSTFMQFGLLDEVADEGYRVTELFHTLNTNPTSSTAFRRAAFTASQRPQIFAEILSEFRTKLPDIQALAQRLETQKKFTADRAKQVAGALEVSLQFAGVLDTNRNIVPIREDASVSVPASDSEGTRSEPGVPAVGASARKTEVPLGEGRVAVVFYPHDLSSNEADKIGRVLRALVD